MTSTRSPRIESFTQPSVARLVPKKRRSLESSGGNSQEPMRSLQRSATPPLPPYPESSFERSSILSSSDTSGSYVLSPEVPSPLWEYPGQDRTTDRRTMTSTRSPRSESFTQPSVARLVPQKRSSLESSGGNSQEPMRSLQRSATPPWPPYPESSFERSSILSSSDTSGSYVLSPEVPSPLWQYPGQEFGRHRRYAATSTQSPRDGGSTYRGGIGTPDTSGSSVYMTGPRSPGATRSPGTPRESDPQFERQGPRRKLSYHPEPTPEITPFPYGPEERPKRRLIPEKRFSQFSDEWTPGEADQSRTSAKPVDTNWGQFSSVSTGAMKPPCFKMQESMFLSDSSTAGVAPFQFGRLASSPVPPGNRRSSYQHGSPPISPISRNLSPGNTRLSSVFFNDDSYSSTPDSDSTGYGSGSPDTQQRDNSRYRGAVPNRIRSDRSSAFFTQSDTSTPTRPPMTTTDSTPARRKGNVFVLNAGTFSNFLQLQNKAAVLFYNSSTNQLEVVENMVKQFVTQNPREERQVYASVDCAQESQLCAREIATNTPFFRMYSKGVMVNEAKDFATLTQRPTARIR